MNSLHLESEPEYDYRLNASSPKWASPVAPRADTLEGSWRVTGDYRFAQYEIYATGILFTRCLSSEDSVTGDGGVRFLGSRPICRAFIQIPVAPGRHPEEAVSVDAFGLFEFVGMPLGLRNSAQTFQRAYESSATRRASNFLPFIRLLPGRHPGDAVNGTRGSTRRHCVSYSRRPDVAAAEAVLCWMPARQQGASPLTASELGHSNAPPDSVSSTYISTSFKDAPVPSQNCLPIIDKVFFTRGPRGDTITEITLIRRYEGSACISWSGLGRSALWTITTIKALNSKQAVF
ncbi:unnamed protein product [Trichogramma brassicae]|uniref:Uncharacterized protein n=1 Tax=Trichogramma brassicae TaxID=86971 RepID=A0A6H5I0I6_9HYME|nr:unnamed protein product [Trichogramma brassicae]